MNKRISKSVALKNSISSAPQKHSGVASVASAEAKGAQSSNAIPPNQGGTSAQKRSPTLKNLATPVQQNENDEIQIFISYQWGIQNEVKELNRFLNEKRFSTWMDIHKLNAGEDLMKELPNAIYKSKAFVCCVTKKYSLSPNCNKEISYANMLRLPIIALMYEDVPMHELESVGFIINPLLRINLFENPEELTNWAGSKSEELIKAINSSLVKTTNVSSITMSTSPSSNSSKALSYFKMSQNKNFICDDNVLNEIQEKLEKERVVAVYGPPGVGKSSTANEIGHRLKQKYTVRWLDCDSAAKFEESLLKFAEILDIEISNRTAKEVFQKILLELSKCKQRFVFILDNVESSDYIEEFIANDNYFGRFFITTRNKHFNTNQLQCYKKEITLLTIDQAKNFLKKTLLFVKDEEQIQNIIEKISKNTKSILALDLNLASSYFNNTGAFNLNENGFNVENLNLFEDMICKELKNKSPESLKILTACSCLDNDFILSSIVEILFKIPNETFAKSVSILTKMSLVEIVNNEQGKTGIRIHRLITEKIKNHDKTETNGIVIKGIEVIEKILDGIIDKTHHKTYANDIINHARKLIENCFANKLNMNSMYRINKKLNDYQIDMKRNLKDLIDKEKQILDSIKNDPEKKHEMMMSLYCIGKSSQILGNNKNALEYFEKGLSITKEVNGERHQETAACLGSIGRCYRNLGENKKALEY